MCCGLSSLSGQVRDLSYLRWRKEKISRGEYGREVDDAHFLHAQTTVEETLTRLPAAVDVFQALQTGCVGCFLARFCSLQYVAEVYGLDLHELFVQLQASTNSS